MMTSMIVCHCNNLNDTDIKLAMANGAKDYEQILAYHDCEVICATCRSTVLETKLPLDGEE